MKKPDLKDIQGKLLEQKTFAEQNGMVLYDPELEDELEEVFHDAHESIANKI